MTRILVAAASVVGRAGLEALVTLNSALTVVGSFSNGATLVQQVRTLQPDVVLLELAMRDELTLEKLLPPSRGDYEPAVVVLADDPDSTWTAEALRAGVRAILPQEATADEIVAAVEAAAAGLVVLHPDIVDIIVPVLPPRQLLTSANQALTPREIEVLGMLAAGLGNKAIARRLGISEHTVKFHVSSLFVKLNASSRTEAVTIGARQGLIML